MPMHDARIVIAAPARYDHVMGRRVTLFSGQWTDLQLETLAASVADWGYDGLELATWGDHFQVQRALADSSYCSRLRAILERKSLGCWAIAAHLIGQAVCDPIEDRHRGMLPPDVWGDGEPEGIHRRAAERMKDTARAAARFGVEVVTGFTGSPIWHLLYPFPANSLERIDRGYQEFAERWGPIIDVFEAEGVRFALEIHPAEIAYDFVTTRRTLDALGPRRGFGLNLDPSHFTHQFLDPSQFASDFAEHICHVHIKDSKRSLDGRRSILGSHLNLGDPDRGWDFVAPGHGDVNFDEFFRALNRIHYQGPLSVECEDSGMDREWEAKSALAFVRRTDFTPSTLT